MSTYNYCFNPKHKDIKCFVCFNKLSKCINNNSNETYCCLKYNFLYDINVKYFGFFFNNNPDNYFNDCLFTNEKMTNNLLFINGKFIGSFENNIEFSFESFLNFYLKHKNIQILQ